MEVHSIGPQSYHISQLSAKSLFSFSPHRNGEACRQKSQFMWAFIRSALCGVDRKPTDGLESTSSSKLSVLSLRQMLLYFREPVNKKFSDDKSASEMNPRILSICYFFENLILIFCYLLQISELCNSFEGSNADVNHA
jgi:hypothetical protein